MKCLVSLPGLIAFLVLGNPLSEGATAPEEDRDRLQGRWSVVSFEDADRGGGKRTDEELKTMKVVIAGDKLTVTEGDTSHEITFKLDAGKNPKQIDLTAPQSKGKANHGIYELDGDNLKICFNAEPEGDRSTTFESKADSPNVVLLILKREK